MTKKQSAERQEAIDTLRATLRPGMTVYTILRSVSRSGMQRVIDVVTVRPEDEPYPDRHWYYSVAIACGYPIDRAREGVKVSGCGQDMGFALVYDLARTLWPDGFGCVGEKCLSNDHSNGDRDRTTNDQRQVGWASCDACCALPDEMRALNHGCVNHSHWHSDGGYALRHRWL